MKITVEVDFKDFYDEFDDMDLVIKEYIRDEIMKTVKKDPKYKLFIQQKSREFLDNIKL